MYSPQNVYRVYIHTKILFIAFHMCHLQTQWRQYQKIIKLRNYKIKWKLLDVYALSTDPTCTLLSSLTR